MGSNDHKGLNGSNGVNGAAHGHDHGGGHGDESEITPERGPAPAVIAELAASCARFVHAKYRVPLDGTSDTLSLLDQYVRDARPDITVKPEALGLLESSIGAYLGEVVRRTYGGEWFCEGDYEAWRLDMTNVFLTFNPIGMAREALLLEEASGWHAHLEMDEAYRDEINRRLAALSPEGVDEDEYFAPTTRFDVISLAVESLRAKMIADGHGDVTFSSEDYRKK